MTCKNKALSPALLRFFSRTARHNPQMRILPVPNWVPHRSSTRFATLGGKHAWQTPCRIQCPPRPRPPERSLSSSEPKQQAGRKEWSDTQANTSANFPAKLTKLAGDVRYAVVIVHANFHLLAPNTSCPKLPAFKTRHGPRGLQAACKQRE